MSTTAPTRLANLWDDAKAAAMSEPERLVYRSNLLGSRQARHQLRRRQHLLQDHAEGPADRRDGRSAVGQGLGRRQRLDQARWLFDALHGQAARAEEASIAASSYEDEMVGYLPHATFNLNPRAASIDTPLHAYVNRTPMSTTCTPTRSSPLPQRRIRKRTDAADLRRQRSAGCRGRSRASSSACGWANSARRIPRPRASILESHGLFTWGDTPKECYETTIAHHQPGDRLVRAADRRQGHLRRRSGAVARPPSSAAPSPRRLMPKIRGLISEDSHKLGHFDDSRCRAGIRQLATTCARWRRSAPPAPTISCAPRSGRW